MSQHGRIATGAPVLSWGLPSAPGPLAAFQLRTAEAPQAVRDPDLPR